MGILISIIIWHDFSVELIEMYADEQDWWWCFFWEVQRCLLKMKFIFQLIGSMLCNIGDPGVWSLFPSGFLLGVDGSYIFDVLSFSALELWVDHMDANQNICCMPS